MSSFRNLVTVWRVCFCCQAGGLSLYGRKTTPYGLLEFVAVIILDTTAVCKKTLSLVFGAEVKMAILLASAGSAVSGVCVCVYVVGRALR